MSEMADLDPKMTAIIAVIMMTACLAIFQLNLPNPSSQKVKISMITGHTSPKMEKQNAPIRETNGMI
jgi:hypothetical protein